MHYNMLNEAMNCSKSVTNPEVSMAGTMYVGTDRYAVVVTEVINNRTIRVEHMSDYDEKHSLITDENGVERLNPQMIGNYVKIEDGKIIPRGKIYTYRKNKRWMPKNEDMWGTCSIHLGVADSYRDPCF